MRQTDDLELSEIKDHFYTEGGNLYVKKPYGRGNNKKCVGELVGWDNLHGRKQLFFSGRVYMVHRVIYYLHYGVWPVGVVDHINGDGFDNNPSNLRDITQKQNCRSHQKIRSGGRYSSVYRGVSLHKPTNTWRARFVEGRSEKSLGYFTCEKEAALAWNYEASANGYNKEAFNEVF